MLAPLVLDAVAESLWSDFQARRGLPRRPPLVIDHWSRSRELGAPARGPQPEDALHRGEPLRISVERTEPLLAAGSGMIDKLSAAAASRGYSLLISDPDGVIVRAGGGGEFADEARRARLIDGAIWNEAARGTNAIGTAAATGQAVFVEGTAHFASAYHHLVCYAAPVFDATGDLAAVIDVTSRIGLADRNVGFGVVAAAAALSELLRVQAYSQAGVTVTRALSRSLERMNCPVALIEPPGRISRLNAPARELFGGVDAGLGCQPLFGLSYPELLDVALTQGRKDIELHSGAGANRYRVRAEPIESEGRIIALLTFFETVRASTRPSRALAPAEPRPFADLFANDPSTCEALTWAARVAPSDIPVILLAETGAGKELVAQGIHRASKRADGPFVAVNCGSIAPTLLESELFGYAPGAFTGAERRGRDGYLGAASGGTLFLDEVAEMPLGMQAALLRVLETGTYQRVGTAKTSHADVRIICATCRDLRAMVDKGDFRKDLFFRLKGATVAVPPLRERKDIAALAQHILGRLASQRRVVPAPTLSGDVLSFFEDYPWPGNVRELKSILDVALVLSVGSSTILLEHLPPDLIAEAESTKTKDLDAKQPQASLASAEASAVRRALDAAAGNVSEAAKKLGVARSTLYRMMRRHDLRSRD